MANPYENPTESPINARPDGGPDSDNPCPPGERKRPTMDGWECVPTGTPQTPSTPDPQPRACPEGQEKSPFDANGNDAPYPLECVTTAEAQRRFELRRNRNNQQQKQQNTQPQPAPVSQPKPTKSPYDAELSKSIFDMVSRMMSGQDSPFGPDTIAKLQAAALQSNKGQLANNERALERRLVSAGLTRSGAAPAAQASLRSSSATDLSNDFRNVALTAVQSNYNARVAGLKEAQNFLASERANSLSQDQMVLAYARLKQEWATTQATFAQQWKLAQDGNEQAIIQLLLSLKGGI